MIYTYNTKSIKITIFTRSSEAFVAYNGCYRTFLIDKDMENILRDMDMPLMFRTLVKDRIKEAMKLG